MDLQADLGISLLFISHDMAVVERIAHRVAVMYLGQIVEIGDRRSIFTNPQHSYTRKLLSSVPVADPRQRTLGRQLLATEIPSALHPADYEPAILPLSPHLAHPFRSGRSRLTPRQSQIAAERQVAVA